MVMNNTKEKPMTDRTTMINQLWNVSLMVLISDLERPWDPAVKEQEDIEYITATWNTTLEQLVRYVPAMIA